MSNERTNVSYTWEIELSVVVCSDYGFLPLSLLNHTDNLIFVMSTLPWTWIHRLHVSQLIRLRIPEQGPMICCGTYIQWDLPWRDRGTKHRNTGQEIALILSNRKLMWEYENQRKMSWFIFSFCLLSLSFYIWQG